MKIRYALRAQRALFRHPSTQFTIQGKNVNMYQFIAYGWKMIDKVMK